MDLEEAAPRCRARRDTRGRQRAVSHGGVQQGLYWIVVLQGLHDWEGVRRYLHPEDGYLQPAARVCLQRVNRERAIR